MLAERNGRPAGDAIQLEMATWEHGNDPQVPWGQMEVSRPRLEKLVCGYSVARRRGAAEEGVVPSHIDRYCTDGRVFERPDRSMGGTILIDGSSSMELSTKDLEEALGVAPGCTIAVYSGDAASNNAGMAGFGSLIVIAHGGRIAQPAAYTGLGAYNLIDGPALRWLVKQPPPRYWVCDGQVTGVGDRHSAANVQECDRIVKQGRVIQVRSLDDLSKALLRR